MSVKLFDLKGSILTNYPPEKYIHATRRKKFYQKKNPQRSYILQGFELNEF